MAPRAAAEGRVFFFCGPDEAGVQDAGKRIVSLLKDPGERIEFTGSDLRRDPVLLGDEARSTSLFGGARHIWVRAQGDEVYEALDILLSGEAEACPVIVVATGATDKSKCAKLLAPRKDALSAMFYPPDLRSVAATVRNMADAAGLRMGGDLAERIARACGLDTRLAQSEITKLALYLDASPESPRSADAVALDQIGAATEADGFMPLVNVVLNGDTARLPSELRRMQELEMNAVAILLALERRCAQLAGLAAKLDGRSDVNTLLEAETTARRIFWKDRPDLTKQLQRWRGAKLERLVKKLMGMHRELLSHSQDAELLLLQGLTEIARVAAASGRPRR